MPDLLSTIIRVSSDVTTSIEALQTYSDVSAYFEATCVSEILAKNDFDCVLMLLSQIQELLRSKPRVATPWTSGEELPGKTLRSIMEACRFIFTVVAKELYELTDETLKSCQPWANKTHFVRLWNVSDVKITLQHISPLFTALDLLHSMLMWYATNDFFPQYR